jgi:hypothetical protein
LSSKKNSTICKIPKFKSFAKNHAHDWGIIMSMISICHALENLGLLYHHHLASGVVANLNHIGAADRCFETQLGELVLFGGKKYFASFTKICTFAT